MTTQSQEQMLNRVMENVAGQVAESIKSAVVEAVEKALSLAMNNALVENEFYKRLNDEMRSGLQNIYKEISVAAAPGADADGKDAKKSKKDTEKTGKLFSEASRQIEEVMNTTLEATESIMATVEDLMERQQDFSIQLVALQDVAPEGVAQKLEAHNIALEEALTSIMTSLSFQDLTGQRLKKVVTALSDIQESIFDMYVSSGLMLKTREEMPEKNLEEITKESRKKFEEIKGSELKGPSSSSSQSDVDSLLADLGL